jgi:ferrochelatase
LLADTLRTMRADGVRRAIAFVTSPFGSYSSCRQYRDDIARARAEVGAGAPEVDKIRHYHDHPGFIEPFADAVRAAWIPGARLVFTAHSIPSTMDAASGPDGGRYTAQLHESAALVTRRALPDAGVDYDLVWQSRSGPPQMPWLEPDINDHLESLAKAGVSAVVTAPVGFISDHLEVLWDLDHEAAQTAARLGLDWRRAATPGTDPRFVAMIAELVRERVDGAPRRKLGELPVWDACPAGCCT